MLFAFEKSFYYPFQLIDEMNLTIKQYGRHKLCLPPHIANGYVLDFFFA